jgi:hypothetical protein
MTYRRGIDRTSRDNRIREPVVYALQPQIFCSFLWSYGPTERPGSRGGLRPAC